MILQNDQFILFEFKISLAGHHLRQEPSLIEIPIIHSKKKEGLMDGLIDWWKEGSKFERKEEDRKKEET